MTIYTQEAVFEAMGFDWVESARVTSTKELDYNTMEGQNYQVNVKLIGKGNYRDRLVRFITNSTYLEDWDAEEETLKSYYDNMLNGLTA